MATELLVVPLLFAVCVAILALMRDTGSVPPHAVSRRVWCQRYRRSAQVDFTERVATGCAFRTVRHCSLRRPGERCGEGCAWQPQRL